MMSMFQIIVCTDKLIVDLYNDIYYFRATIKNFNKCKIYNFDSCDVLALKQFFKCDNHKVLPIFFHEKQHSLIPCRMNAYLVRDIIQMHMEELGYV